MRATISAFSRSRLTTCSDCFADKAAALAAGGDPYDALLDENEPGMTRARLAPVLEELA